MKQRFYYPKMAQKTVESYIYGIWMANRLHIYGDMILITSYFKKSYISSFIFRVMGKVNSWKLQFQYLSVTEYFSGNQTPIKIFSHVALLISFCKEALLATNVSKLGKRKVKENTKYWQYFSKFSSNPSQKKKNLRL